MTEDGDKGARLRIVENPQRGEIFADGAVGFSLVNGVVRVTLTALRPVQPDDQLAHVVIGRLAMPVKGAEQLAIKLYDFLKVQGGVRDDRTPQ